MKALLLKYWDRLRSSFWFVPAAMACLAGALALCAVAIDRAVADEVAFVPHLSVSIGVLLAMVSIGVLIYFIHHVSVSIQADEVVARVGRELEDGIDKLFPGRLGKTGSEASESPTEVDLPAVLALAACPVGAPEDGCLQLIDGDALMALASREDLLLKLERRLVHYLVKGQTMVTVWPADAYVDRLGSALCRLARRDAPSPLRHDDEGRLRLVAPGSIFTGMVDAAFNQIRQSARSNPAVAIRMLNVIAQIAGHVQHTRDAACLQRHAGMIVSGARHAVPEAEDRLAVEARFKATDQLLRSLHG